jgi:transcriptional regulator with XRE-family HTH domain
MYYKASASVHFHLTAEASLRLAMITAAQARAARALLRWSLKEVATKANVSIVTVSRFETELANPIPATRAAIQKALEGGGVEFTNGDAPGVRLPRRR